MEKGFSVAVISYRTQSLFIVSKHSPRGGNRYKTPYNSYCLGGRIQKLQKLQEPLIVWEPSSSSQKISFHIWNCKTSSSSMKMRSFLEWRTWSPLREYDVVPYLQEHFWSWKPSYSSEIIRQMGTYILFPNIKRLELGTQLLLPAKLFGVATQIDH